MTVVLSAVENGKLQFTKGPKFQDVVVGCKVQGCKVQNQFSQLKRRDRKNAGSGSSSRQPTRYRHSMYPLIIRPVGVLGNEMRSAGQLGNYETVTELDEIKILK
jgi:hypothetical protein